MWVDFWNGGQWMLGAKQGGIVVFLGQAGVGASGDGDRCFFSVMLF
ncbi:hypothetical protein SMIM3I_02244 [Streptococcus mitis]|uniref:Uncharacterized protein n=1 Tax=Streptococcus mitis TaxID=28037 RepID=A0A150NNH3_STRMT|nr:hypothetical protein SMIM3I_02244 [Streptococcus mitis]